jgi:WD40 repeat protein
MSGHTDVVYSLAWAPDGSRLASTSCDGSLILWDPLNAREIVTFRTHANQVIWVAWSRDGRKLATSSADRTIQVFDAGDFRKEPKGVLGSKD